MAAMTDGALSTFSKSFVQALQFPTVRAVLEKKNENQEKLEENT